MADEQRSFIPSGLTRQSFDRLAVCVDVASTRQPADLLRGADGHLESVSPMPTVPGSLLTIDELAEYLKISKATLYKLAQEGSIPSQKVGKHWRFHKDAVDEWLRQRGPIALPPKSDPET